VHKNARLEHQSTVFAKDFNISDLERLGPIIERLLESGKPTDDEVWAVDLCFHAASDLASIRHTEVAREFYARPEIQERSADSIRSWLATNGDAKPGTVVSICGRIHVVSMGMDGNLQLCPVLDL
jgi:hypothetical protein